MPWFTTKDGRHFNTDWMDEDEKKKYSQIIKNQEEITRRNIERIKDPSKKSPYQIWSEGHLSSKDTITKQYKAGNISKEKHDAVVSKMDAEAQKIAESMSDNFGNSDLYKTANGFVLDDGAKKIFMDDDGQIRKIPAGEMNTAHTKYHINAKDNKDRQISQNKTEAENLKNLELSKPIFGGDYKATSEMVQIVGETAEKMQEEFPILRKSFNIDINKNMDAGGLTWDANGIELRGATLKHYLHWKDPEQIRGITAHELTHVMQHRLVELKGLPKYIHDEESIKYIDSIWNRAVERYVKANPKFTIKEVNKIMANAYGEGGHSRIGSTSIEKMAVAVEAVYRGWGQTEIGKYVIEELKKEMS